MKASEKIDVICFGREIGRLAWNQQRAETTFQYNPDYLTKDIYSQLIPETGFIKRIASPQVFRSLDRSSFRGLPSVFADSLPDEFGNKLFKTWLESQKNKKEISALEQLTYVAHRGMGALEYKPAKSMASRNSIRLNEVVSVLKEVLESKENISKLDIDESTLLTLYKIGTSAGGVRPKVLISENISSGRMIPRRH
jgi:serine/threonine-protein kinase HipA